MKLLILFTFIIAMFFVSTVTFGDILYDPEGTGTSASASASASKGKPPQMEYKQYWWNEYTDEAGTFQWHIEADAEAHASAEEGNGWVLAIGDASAFCGCRYDVVDVGARAVVDSDDEDDDDPPKEKNDGTGWFDAYQGVYGECDAFAYAEIEEGSTSSANSNSESLCYPAMSE